MIVQRIVSDLLSSNMYIIIEDSKAIVIDPCRNTKLPEKVSPELIILTHEHYDHISGVNLWKSRYGIPVLCSESCGKSICSSQKNMSRYFEAFCKLQMGLGGTLPDKFDPDYACQADQVFDDDTCIKWRGSIIKLMLLPGHSPGSIGILINDCLFAGDSMFESMDTVLQFPGGSKSDWRDISLPKIRQLQPNMTVYPGHFDSFTLKNWGPYGEEI